MPFLYIFLFPEPEVGAEPASWLAVVSSYEFLANGYRGGQSNIVMAYIDVNL